MYVSDQSSYESDKGDLLIFFFVNGYPGPLRMPLDLALLVQNTDLAHWQIVQLLQILSDVIAPHPVEKSDECKIWDWK